jgi:putative ATPase
MLDAGEDPRFLARRLVRMAVEDIGLADPQALVHAAPRRRPTSYLGSPEGELALARRSSTWPPRPNRTPPTRPTRRRLVAAKKQRLACRRPSTILNAPTKLMKEEGYGADYAYDHDAPDAFSGQDYWPDALGRQLFYDPPSAASSARSASGWSIGRSSGWSAGRADGPPVHVDREQGRAPVPAYPRPRCRPLAVPVPRP